MSIHAVALVSMTLTAVAHVNLVITLVHQALLPCPCRRLSLADAVPGKGTLQKKDDMRSWQLAWSLKSWKHCDFGLVTLPHLIIGVPKNQGP